ncbi:YraN family protein [Actinomycetes bacterium KLBMP 9759]
MAAKDVLGRQGEELAVRYLERQGFTVLSRNWRCRIGEIDVIATRASLLVACEVKTRSGTRFGAPSEAVDSRKSIRIRRVLNAWLRTHRVRWCDIRFDVVSIVAERGRPVALQHLEGVF